MVSRQVNPSEASATATPKPDDGSTFCSSIRSTAGADGAEAAGASPAPGALAPPSGTAGKEGRNVEEPGGAEGKKGEGGKKEGHGLVEERRAGH